jgi:hypothetical protein
MVTVSWRKDAARNMLKGIPEAASAAEAPVIFKKFRRESFLLIIT